MYKKISYNILLVIIVLFSGCSKDDKEDNKPEKEVKSGEAIVKTFVFSAAKNKAITKDYTGTINATNYEITTTLPYSTDISALKADITVSDKAIMTPDMLLPHDYSKPVMFKVISEDESIRRDYKVLVKKDKPYSQKGSVLYLESVELNYNGTNLKMREDSIIKKYSDQKVYHIVQKHNKIFYTIEVNLVNDAEPFKIINSFDNPTYNNSEYQRNELRKLPLPFTQHSYKANSETDIAKFSVNQIIDDKGYITNIPSGVIDTWKAIARKTVGSVVRIQGGGTGWFVDKDLVVTNKHVVENMGSIVYNGDYNQNPQMSIELFDGRKTTGRTWFASSDHDVALVKLDQSFDDISLLSVTNRDTEKGELVLNIGGPNIAQTYGKHLAMLGVMNTPYTFNFDLPLHISCIAGQSGSPVFNLRGEVVGMMKLSGYGIDIRDDINYFEIPSKSIIFAEPKVIENPVIGPKSSTLIGGEAITRLLNHWLTIADRKFPDQKLKLNQDYSWQESSEEFYAKYNIGFPESAIANIEISLPENLKSIVTIQKRILDPQSNISAETAVVYDENYLLALCAFPYSIGDIFDVISYDRSVREAKVVAKGKQNGPSTYYVLKLAKPFKASSVRYIKSRISEISTDQGLLSYGRSYYFPYPGCFQVNQVMYRSGNLHHLNALTDKLPLFTTNGEFVGYTEGGYTVDESQNVGSRLYIRTTIPITHVVLPHKLVKASDIITQFPILK
jgi:hypothetical protein